MEQRRADRDRAEHLGAEMPGQHDIDGVHPHRRKLAGDQRQGEPRRRAQIGRKPHCRAGLRDAEAQWISPARFSASRIFAAVKPGARAMSRIAFSRRAISATASGSFVTAAAGMTTAP